MCPAQGKFKCNKPNHYSRMCRSKAVHECDVFIGVVKNEGEDEVSVKLVIEYSHAVKVKLDIYKTRESHPQIQTQPTQY